MNNNAKILLNVIKQLGFDAYFYGGCSRNALSPKASIRNRSVEITIITNAPIERIKATFVNYKEHTNNSVYVIFANIPCIVISYVNITELQEQTNFLCNTIYLADNKKDNPVDFKINNHSALSDIENSIVRCVNKNAKEYFIANPLEMLEALKLMSIYGFTLDKTLITGMKNAIKHIKYIPIKVVINYFNKIIVGVNAEQTLKLMVKLNIFKLSLYTNNVRYPFFKIFDTQPELLDILGKIKNTNKELHEIYSLLFLNNKDEFNLLTEQFPLFDNEEDINTINWIINNLNIVNETDKIKQRNLIYNSMTDYIKSKNIHYLKILIEHISHVHKILYGTNSLEDLIFNISCRPYFIDQLSTSDTDVQSLISDSEVEKCNIDNIKNELIKLLLNEQSYPEQQIINTKLLSLAIKNTGVSLKNEY